MDKQTLPCSLFDPVYWSRRAYHYRCLTFNILNTKIDKWIDFVRKALLHKGVQVRSGASVVKRDLALFIVQQNPQSKRLRLKLNNSMSSFNSFKLTLFVKDYSPETFCRTENDRSSSLGRFSGHTEVVTKLSGYRHLPVMSARREADHA